MNVDVVYRIVLFAVKNNINGNVTPDEFNLIINNGSLSYCNFLIGQLQSYQYQRPESRVQFGNNMIARQKLTPCIYGYILNVDSTGFSPYPADYLQADTMLSMYGLNNIRGIQQNYSSSVYNSAIDPVASNPIYLVEELGFRFYPLNVGQARLSYVRNPRPIVWGYTIDANGREVYNPATSIDPDWGDDDVMEVIVRALKLVGVNLQLQMVYQYSQQIKEQGQ